MAKATLPTNFQDDILSEAMDGKRRYNLIQNSDGTVSLEDATDYSQIGSNFGAVQMNSTNTAVNESVDKAVVIDNKNDLMANTTSGKVAGVLAVKNIADELSGKIDNLPASLAEWKVLGSYVNDGIKSCNPLSGHGIIAISLFDNANNASHGFNMIPLELFKLYNSNEHAFGISGYINGRIFCYVNYVNNTAVNIQVTPGYGVTVYGF